MAMSVGEIEATLRLRDEMTGQLRAAQPALAQFGTSATAAAEKLGPLNRGMRETTSSVIDARGAFGHLSDAAKDPTGALGNLAAAATEMAGPIGIAAAAVVGLSVAGIAAAEKLFELTESAAKVGASIHEFSLRAQISVKSASELRFVAQALGKDTESLGSAMFMMSRRIGEGLPAVEKGLKALGITWKEFVDVKPDEQLLRISDAMRALSPEINKSQIAFDLMGRQGREQLPLLLRPLRELVAEGDRLGIVWSEKDVEAARDFEVATNTLRIELARFWTTLGKDLMPTMIEFVKMLESSKAAMVGIPELAHAIAGALNDLIGQQKNNIILIEAAIVGYKDLATALHLIAPAASHANDALDEASLKLVLSTTRTAQKSDADKIAALMTDLHTESEYKLSKALAGYIDEAIRVGKTNEEIKQSLIDARVAGGDVELAIRAMRKEYEEAAKATERFKEVEKQWTEFTLHAHRTVVESMIKLSNIIRSEADKMVKDVTDVNLKLRQMVIEQRKALGIDARDIMTPGQRQQFNAETGDPDIDALQKEFAAKRAEAEKMFQQAGKRPEVDRFFQEYMQNLDKEYEQRFNGLMKKTQEFGAQMAGELGKQGPALAEASAAATKPMVLTFIGAFQEIADAAQAAAQQVQQILHDEAMEEAYKAAGIFMNSDASILMNTVNRGKIKQKAAAHGNLNLLPHFDAGGAGNFGSGTLAVLHGREAIVPLDKADKIGSFGGIRITVNIAPGAADTPGSAARLGRAAADGIVSRLKARGVRGLN